MFLQKYNQWIESQIVTKEIKNELKTINNDKERGR